VWKDESHGKRVDVRKADDASVYETGEGSGGSSRVRASEGAWDDTGHGGCGSRISWGMGPSRCAVG